MNQPRRRPALAPPPIRPALPCAISPAAFLLKHYQHVWQTRMQDLPFVNAKLAVEAIGFVRHEGDWLGVVITPWFLNLFLLSGGGTLWTDVAAGERCYVHLPCGALQFIADDDPDIGPYQYCPLVAAVGRLPDHVMAHQAALDALQTVFTAPAPDPAAEAGSEAAPETAAQATPDTAPSKPQEPSRRGFFRGLAGKR